MTDLLRLLAALVIGATFSAVLAFTAGVKYGWRIGFNKGFDAGAGLKSGLSDKGFRLTGVTVTHD